MGEYAVRSSDRARIKIGTCEDMYYLRFEDRHKIIGQDGNVNPAIDSEADGLRFRLPFADEDDKLPGEYEEYNRNVRLYRQDGNHEDFTDESTVDDPGIIQLHHESGLLVNVPCLSRPQVARLRERCSRVLEREKLVACAFESQGCHGRWRAKDISRRALPSL